MSATGWPPIDSKLNVEIEKIELYSGLGLGIALKLSSGAVVCQYSLAVSLRLQATMCPCYRGDNLV